MTFWIRFLNESEIFSKIPIRIRSRIGAMRVKFTVLILILLGLLIDDGLGVETGQQAPYRIHTLFSVECQNYFDWQTVGLMHSFKKAGQPGPITRLLSCTEEEKKKYKGMHLAPTLEVPSMSKHPKTGDWSVSFILEQS